MRPAEPPPSRPPWEDLAQTCDPADDPAPVERRWEGEPEVERLVVPVTIEPELRVPVAWAAIGGEEPDISPFGWYPPDLENDPPRYKFVTRLAVEHREADELHVALAPFSYLTGQVVELTLHRSPGEPVTATLHGYDYTDYGPPFRFPWEDLGGEVRLSADRWEPGDELALHLEVGRFDARVCARVRLSVGPEGGVARVEL